MAWQGIYGHDAIAEAFRMCLARGRLASSFLFVGPSGIGKRTFAIRLSAALLCEQRPEQQLDPCGQCSACQQVAAGTHPDLLQISKPPDKSELPLSLFVGERERRNQEGLCHDIAMRPARGKRRVAIVDDADLLTEEAANSLLKTLEEPPPGSVLILIGTSPERQLPTIRSRCQLVRFQPPAEDDAARLIAAQLAVADPAEARRLAAHAGGSMQRAAQLRDAELWEFRQGFVLALADLPTGAVPLATRTVAFVEQAGKETVERRTRLRMVIEFAVDFYHAMLRQRSGMNAQFTTADPLLSQAAQRAIYKSGSWNDERAADCLERSLEALGHVDRNAHLTTLTECWIDELAQLSAGNWLPVIT